MYGQVLSACKGYEASTSSQSHAVQTVRLAVTNEAVPNHLDAKILSQHILVCTKAFLRHSIQKSLLHQGFFSHRLKLPGCQYLKDNGLDNRQVEGQTSDLVFCHEYK